MSRIVIIESPYAGDIDRNVKYAQLCVADSLRNGESPFASHLLYTQPNVLDDSDPNERELGIKAGFAFKHCENAITAFYTDLGFSSGMEIAMKYCKENNLPFEFRQMSESIDITARGDGMPGRKVLKRIQGMPELDEIIT